MVIERQPSDRFGYCHMTPTGPITPTLQLPDFAGMTVQVPFSPGAGKWVGCQSATSEGESGAETPERTLGWAEGLSPRMQL